MSTRPRPYVLNALQRSPLGMRRPEASPPNAAVAPSVRPIFRHRKAAPESERTGVIRPGTVVFTDPWANRWDKPVRIALIRLPQWRL